MRRSRRLISIILAFIFIMLPFTACGNNKNANEEILDANNPVTIEIWHYYNGPQKEIFDEYIKSFNITIGKEKGIIVKATSHGSINELTENVITATEANAGTIKIPEVFASYPDLAYMLNKKGFVASINDYLSKIEIDSYVDSYVAEGMIGEDKSFGIFPVAKATEVLMFNKTDLDTFFSAINTSNSNITFTEADLQTWEGIVKTAKNYYEWTDGLTNDIKNDGKAFFGIDSLSNYIIIGAKQLGIDLIQITDDNAQINLDRDTMKTLWNNYYVPYVNGYFAEYESYRTDDIKSGKIIGFVSSTTSCTYFPDEVIKEDGTSYPVEALTLKAPYFENSEKYAIQQGAGMVITKSTKEKEYAATVFLKWFTETERNINFQFSSGYFPVTKASQTDSAILEIKEKITTDTNLSQAVKSSIPVALEQLKEYKLFYTKPFLGGVDVRNILSVNLRTTAISARAEVVALIENGTTRDYAITQLTEDIYFDKWLLELQKSLNLAIDSAS